MKDKNGHEITLGIIANYKEATINDISAYVYSRIGKQIGLSDSAILDEQTIKIIDPVLYTELKKGTFIFPNSMFIPYEKVESILNIERKKCYYSETTDRTYFYHNPDFHNHSKSKLRDWTFLFSYANGKQFYFDLHDRDFNYKYHLNIKSIEELHLQLIDCFVFPQLPNFFDSHFYYSRKRHALIKHMKGLNFIDEWESQFTIETIEDLRDLEETEPWHKPSFYELRIEIIKEIPFYVEIYVWETVGHYRGEDSGAIYPEIQKDILCVYDVTSKKDYVLSDGKTVEWHCHNIIENMYACKNGYSILYAFLMENPSLCLSPYTPIHRPHPK